MLLARSRLLVDAAKQVARKAVTAPLSTSKVLNDSHGALDPRLYVVGPYPKTKEERDAAARKYNLIPEDYEPYPPGEGFGDYPYLPLIGNQNLDQYDDYDDPFDHRNYGEPYHRDTDMYYHERMNPVLYDEPDPSYTFRLLFLLGLVSTFAIGVLGPGYFDLHINHPWKLERHYGLKRENMVHYGFPESESSKKDHH